MNIHELNVLIVEDDDFQRQMVIGMLGTLGVSSIFDAGNGVQALDIIRGEQSKTINIALCDLNMPEMDGMEFLRHLSQESLNVAIIITSALDSKLLSSVKRMTKLYNLDLLGTIEKPILLQQLKDLLSKYQAPTNIAAPPMPPNKDFSLEEILQGIAANEFEPFFQPKVDLKTGRLVGAEALARWIHPVHGIISPYAFIPKLEQSGNMETLTFMMLEKAAQACRKFHDKDHALTVSINLSLTSLDDTKLADKITRITQNAGIDPRYIVLEVTESAAMTDVAHALENLARLCMNGFELSIDDYGTGYSTLQQLTRIAFSELKIDQSFVKDFSDQPSLRIVVQSSIDMAHKLQVKSVAEGVETQQEWEILKHAGCDFAQGYFFAKPMDMETFCDFMTQYHLNAACPSSPTTQDLSKARILVVEDNDFERKIILQVLHDLGYSKTIEASSAEMALQVLESQAVDLIVTDVDMPVMNGMEFIQRIRSGKTLANIGTRIVVLTAFSKPEILGTALALDVNGFLVKPIIPAVVEAKLLQALTERLHLHHPFAYGAVKTDLKALPKLHRAPQVKSAQITLRNHSENAAHEGRELRHFQLNELRPGMILRENVCLTDGTLLLSTGHVLTEATINRLHDINTMLPMQSVSVQV